MSLEKERTKNEVASQQYQIAALRWRTCLNCEFFDEKIENCKLFNARPPIKIIVTGCEGHTYDIPF